ncbi:MAG TPA: DnaJ domain-containing protein [Xanthobacteraceae bacterium]|nr:DnaJ domain-containing protein [Xanthobacteraceae bacterium]
MPTVLLGIAVLALVLWGLHKLAKANPRQLATGVKTAGGVGALAGAALLTVRGQLGLAIPLGVAGLALLGWWPGMPAGYGQRWNKTSGQVSRVRTAFIEMELSHDTGAMQGRILAGTYEGATLDALNIPTLTRLLGDIDDESRALLAAYLDRRDPRWRENADAGAAAGSMGAAGGGPMTPEEAYQVLGLQPGASAHDIARAHRNLMKKLHPDQGGSTYLAARVNQAKDVLLRRHS